MRKKMAAALGLCLFAAATVALAEGLDAEYGKNLPSIKVKGKEFKVLRKGRLESGDSIQVSKVVFEKNAKAILFAIGEGEGSDMDLLVADANGKEIGKDVLVDNIPVVEWQTDDGDRSVVNLRLLNSGKKAGNFVLLANW